MRPKNRKCIWAAEPSRGDDEAINIILSQCAMCRKKQKAQEQEQESKYIEESMDVCSAFPFLPILTRLVAR